MISKYKEKLKDTVQQGIAYITGITSFELLVTKSIEIDQVLYKIAKASIKKDGSCAQKPISKDSTPSQPKNSSSSHSKHSAPQNASASHASTQRSSSTPHPHPSHPRGPLSPEERTRREANHLCMYCSDGDHQIQDCPHLRSAVKKGHAKPHYTISSISPVPASSNTTVVPLPPRLSLYRENPRLRAPSDRITEKHHFGISVDFVA